MMGKTQPYECVRMKNKVLEAHQKEPSKFQFRTCVRLDYYINTRTTGIGKALAEGQELDCGELGKTEREKCKVSPSTARPEAKSISDDLRVYWGDYLASLSQKVKNKWTADVRRIEVAGDMTSSWSDIKWSDKQEIFSNLVI